MNLWIDEFGFHLNKSVHPYFFQSWRKFTFVIHIPKQLLTSTSNCHMEPELCERYLYETESLEKDILFFINLMPTFC